MQIYYHSTRGHGERLSGGAALLRGIAPDGGLYVPSFFPRLSPEALAGASYPEAALAVLGPFLPDLATALPGCLATAYGPDNFDAAAPVVESGGGFFLELFHGPTLAFKDMALALLPHLMAAANPGGEKILILTATSGDTGKAALAGFAGVAGTEIVVFYPKDGVSSVQELQMITQEGANTHVAGVRGNFDDAQAGVKKIFADPGLREELGRAGFSFSSANSINIGRLLPQIVYYFYAYLQLAQGGRVAMGAPVNFTVPTGNFGDILAGWYAMQMGLPVGKLICASNSNNVLCDFFTTGVYDKNRGFVQTISPSMDILISSNLERLLFHVSGSAAVTDQCMEGLAATGRFRFEGDLSAFWAATVTEAETRQAIAQAYGHGYVMDPHTAVAYAARGKYQAATGDTRPNVIVATASPYKFADAVLEALAHPPADGLAAVEALARLRGEEAPLRLRAVFGKTIRHRALCAPEAMAGFVRDVLYGQRP
jgi:threonine synthase